ncbi:CBO0543 family protein [Evansella clarkii]|uniref:CBO0543 family protein n=1 Tax=Evansella clarkii TaxID=79879 RepID=UPI001FCFFB4D|nr:CBO0543 family protein [Evansella clarkii]
MEKGMGLMYLLFVVIVYIIFAKVFVDWKRWKEFYPTIQFYIVCNLLYNFLFYNHPLWSYKAVTVDWLNHTLIDLTFTLFIVPVVLMIYLQYYPAGKKQWAYIFAWVLYFTLIEFLFIKKGLFVLDNGWTLWWSFIFNIITFTIIKLHHKNTLLGLIVAVPVIFVLLLFFHPPLQDLK